MASEKTDELYRLLLEKGYPKEFCQEVAYKNLNTDYTATRMIGYLYRISDPKIEMLVDEMLAILISEQQNPLTIIKIILLNIKNICSII